MSWADRCWTNRWFAMAVRCDGNRHNNENLPLLLAGGGGGTIDSGRHIRVAPETPACNLFMSMLDRFGTPVDFVGDSTGRLSGLQI